MSKALWCLYEEEIPTPFFDFLLSPEMKRLQSVGMHCGLEYTSFPFYKDFQPYSRYDHSLGVGLIVYHFTKDLKQSLAGLFHDIATPVFAHVIDFLKGDYQKQEVTEENTFRILNASYEIQKGLAQYHLITEDVSDYHNYPIADNDSPRLSADRLEYTLNNLVNYSFASLDQVRSLYEDLTITKNEHAEPELSFRHLDKAILFTHLTLMNSRVYTADEDRYGMEYLARLLKKAIQNGILSEADLYQREEDVIQKLFSDKQSREDWERFRSLHQIRKEEKPSSPNSYRIASKKRYIDPLVEGKGRVSQLDIKTAAEIHDFLSLSFDRYLVREE